MEWFLFKTFIPQSSNDNSIGKKKQNRKTGHLLKTVGLKTISGLCPYPSSLYAVITEWNWVCSDILHPYTPVPFSSSSACWNRLDTEILKLWANHQIRDHSDVTFYMLLIPWRHTVSPSLYPLHTHTHTSFPRPPSLLRTNLLPPTTACQITAMSYLICVPPLQPSPAIQMEAWWTET